MAQTQTVIRANDVSRLFGKNQVLRNISLDIKQGDVYGLLGPSGSGKTTLVRILAGIDQASEGEVFVLQERMPKLRVMNHIGYMAQADALYSELSARENLQFFGLIYGLKRKSLHERMEQVLQLVELKADKEKPVKYFSGGMKRRLSLAIALLHQPQILVLDEPTVGIDPLLRQSIWEELHRLRNQGATIIVTTHVMDEAKQCDQLAMIREGRLIAAGTPQELIEQAQVKTIEEAFMTFGRNQ